jgi:hypothetical protein
MNDSYKLKNGDEVLIGLNIYNQWAVSCWDEEMNNRWEKIFDNEADARKEFERWRK